ncbi:lactoylglutathione lyase [Paenibacillus sp. PastF-3]|uniref:VOC family protein n=1 Tax=Paenibacillus sp. PastF-3 TaxID=2940626 RepID=UPI002473059B|nr:VOC family protein [Paenibacillus sp. PastF-3]MDH6369400.1 lactoylglutathione lyase [Paenibacillus sp. PastF-3]
MPNITVISINVADMTIAIDFYCNKLGFEISTQYDDSLVSLKHEPIPIVLCQVELSTQVQYPRESQVVIGLQVEDLVTSIKQYKQLGIEVLYDETRECPPGIYSAIADPFGNVIELLEYR